MGMNAQVLYAPTIKTACIKQWHTENMASKKWNCKLKKLMLLGQPTSLSKLLRSIYQKILTLRTRRCPRVQKWNTISTTMYNINLRLKTVHIVMIPGNVHTTASCEKGRGIYNSCSHVRNPHWHISYMLTANQTKKYKLQPRAWQWGHWSSHVIV